MAGQLDVVTVAKVLVVPDNAGFNGLDRLADRLPHCDNVISRNRYDNWACQSQQGASKWW